MIRDRIKNIDVYTWEFWYVVYYTAANELFNPRLLDQD